MNSINSLDASESALAKDPTRDLTSGFIRAIRWSMTPLTSEAHGLCKGCNLSRFAGVLMRCILATHMLYVVLPIERMGATNVFRILTESPILTLRRAWWAVAVQPPHACRNALSLPLAGFQRTHVQPCALSVFVVVSHGLLQAYSYGVIVWTETNQAPKRGSIDSLPLNQTGHSQETRRHIR